MAYDFYAVQALAADLNEALAGSEITRASTLGQVLFLAFNKEKRVLVADCRHRGDLLLSERESAPTGARAAGPEKYFVGAQVRSVIADENDRLIRIGLERRNRAGEISYGQFVCELIANKVNCALVSERSGEVLGAWGDERRMREGRPYVPPQDSARLVPGQGRFEDAIMEGISGGLGEACRQIWVGLDRQVCAELFHRIGLQDDSPASRAHLEMLWETVGKLGREDAGGFVYRVKEQWHFSVYRPQRLEDGEYVLHPSLSAAIEVVRTKNRECVQAKRGDERILALLRRELKKAKRRVEALKRDLPSADEAEIIEREGHILLAHLNQVPTGAAQVELADIFDAEGQGRCQIKLNAKLSPAENAAALLKRAKKYARRRKIIPPRLRKLEGERDELFEKLQCAEKMGIDEELQAWLKEKALVPKEGATKKNKRHGPNQGEAHPRQYTTADGWRVLAGRNNKENDILTHRVAAQNDVWFHAHGYPGSHVILRREGRKDDPSKRTLEEAAAIAAFWSKGKSAKKVPVVYTLAKYVSKPRGGAPGQALMRREKTLIVEPKVPEISDDNKS